MTKYLLLGLIILTIQFGLVTLNDNFMDCPGNEDPFWSWLRRCCHSEELPNDCECFDISFSSDFTNSAFHLPKCPDDMTINFLLYDNDNHNASTLIKAGADNINKTNFNGTMQTVFVAHGFGESWPIAWMEDMKNALLGADDMNVILVDWEDGVRLPNYYQAVANSRTLGAMIGRLIYDLHVFAGARYEDFLLVGHSLGAHAMGYAGNEIFRLTGKQIGRISGLDPAGPQFEGYPETIRLSASDAVFVDVIHTDAEPLYSSGFGIDKNCGDVDFYPNGGAHQPGCPDEVFGIFSLYSITEKELTGACSHMRAPELFTNSISRCRYDPHVADGQKCTMGYHVGNHCRGEYSVTTTDKDPFC